MLIRQYDDFTKDYTFDNFLSAYISNTQTLELLKKEYTFEELNIKIKKNLETTIKLLKRNKNLLHEYYISQKNLAKEYYNNTFKNESKRVIIFDIGYNGSISLGISGLSSKIIDKIYIHQTNKNVFRDNKNNSYTFILKNGIESNKYCEIDLLLEECFSSLEGTCIGFKKSSENISPITEKLNISEEMKNTHNDIQNMTEIFIKKLIGTFGEYIKYINIVDINSIFELTINNFKKNYKEKEIFNSIIYNDTAVRHKQIPLSKKCLK